MRVQLAYVSPRRELKSAPAQALVTEYAGRAARYTPTVVTALRTEEAVLELAERRSGRAPAHLVLLDSRGRGMHSAQFAAYLGRQRDSGAQELLLAIGPADGWSAAARARADLLLSLGTMTLPHELALVVLAEQVYRALTILAGHPYHCGHE